MNSHAAAEMDIAIKIVSNISIETMLHNGRILSWTAQISRAPFTMAEDLCWTSLVSTPAGNINSFIEQQSNCGHVQIFEKIVYGPLHHTASTNGTIAVVDELVLR